MRQPDEAVTWTAIALAESGGRTTNVPFVFVTVEGDSSPASAHVAISLGDGFTIEARAEHYGFVSTEIEVLVPQVFDTFCP
jgi:hypothetical protein